MGIEPFQQLPDGPVELAQAEEGDFPEPGQDPAFDQKYPRLRFGLVLGPVFPSGDDGTAVMGGQILVGGIDVRVVTTGLTDPAFEIIRDQISVTPPKKVKARTWEPIQSGSCCVQVASA